jgi:hypothetical protein
MTTTRKTLTLITVTVLAALTFTACGGGAVRVASPSAGSVVVATSASEVDAYQRKIASLRQDFTPMSDDASPAAGTGDISAMQSDATVVLADVQRLQDTPYPAGAPGQELMDSALNYLATGLQNVMDSQDATDANFTAGLSNFGKGVTYFNQAAAELPS